MLSLPAAASCPHPPSTLSGAALGESSDDKEHVCWLLWSCRLAQWHDCNCLHPLVHGRYFEDSIVRHIEPTHAGHLELRRLSNFFIRLVRTRGHVLTIHYSLWSATECYPGLPAASCCAHPLWFTFVQIPTPNPAVHVYEAVPKAEEADFGGLKSPLKGNSTTPPPATTRVV